MLCAPAAHQHINGAHVRQVEKHKRSGAEVEKTELRLHQPTGLDERLVRNRARFACVDSRGASA
jgi:hypothetical protein